MLTAVDPDGANTFTYDALNRVKTVQEPFGLTLTYSYDAADNRTVFQDSKGGTETFAYDAANNLTSVKFTNSLATVGFDYAYDARNAITKLTRYGSITGLATVGWTSFTYDSRGRLTNQQHRDSSNTSLNNTTFTYDNFDRLTTKVVNGTTTTYSYDNTNQLTDDGTASYSYDANGNRTMTGYTTGTGNQTTNDGTWTYSYDTEGNLSKKSKGASLETWNYSYDQQNHLVSVEKHATDGGTLQLKVQYKYDALDNRIERTEDSDGDGNVDVTERFGYDGSDVWADLNTNNNITYRRLFGPGVDEPVARITAAGTVVWYLTDYQHSVIGMVDSTGSSLGSITYDGFDNVLTNTIGVNGDRYGYTSRELDSVTGDWYYRERYYKSAIGKWTSMDPLGFEAGDANLYRYVGNGPTNGADPSGLKFYVIPKPGVWIWNGIGWDLHEEGSIVDIPEPPKPVIDNSYSPPLVYIGGLRPPKGTPLPPGVTQLPPGVGPKPKPPSPGGPTPGPKPQAGNGQGTWLVEAPTGSGNYWSYHQLPDGTIVGIYAVDSTGKPKPGAQVHVFKPGQPLPTDGKPMPGAKKRMP